MIPVAPLSEYVNGPVPPGVTVKLPLLAPLQVGTTDDDPSVRTGPAVTVTLIGPLLQPAAFVTTTV